MDLRQVMACCVGHLTGEKPPQQTPTSLSDGCHPPSLPSLHSASLLVSLLHSLPQPHTFLHAHSFLSFTFLRLPSLLPSALHFSLPFTPFSLTSLLFVFPSLVFGVVPSLAILPFLPVVFGPAYLTSSHIFRSSLYPSISASCTSIPYQPYPCLSSRLPLSSPLLSSSSPSSTLIIITEFFLILMVLFSLLVTSREVFLVHRYNSCLVRGFFISLLKYSCIFSSPRV